VKIKSTIKTTLLNALDFMPGNVGYMLYHELQKRVTSSTSSKVESNYNSYKTIERLLSEAEVISRKTILEVGSGWMPIMPYFFKYFGSSDKIYTYDINNHYDNKYIDELNSIFKSKYKKDVFLGSGKYHFPNFIIYLPNQNFITSNLPEEVDLVFSRFVLEHVTPEDLLKMHQKFASDLPRNALILHLISPSDHRAYSDKSVSHYDFLKYSQKEWDGIQTKFDYHNRMRLPQYLDTFSNAGFEVVHLEYDKVDTSSEKYQKFKKLKLHVDFESYSEEELLAGSINVLLRKK
jgi:hypothetical protein